MNSKNFARETAVKLPLIELSEGDFFPGIQEFEGMHLITKKGFRASRVNIWGIMQGKKITQEGTMLELNDLTSKIDVLIPDELNFDENFNEGESLQIIGKIRQGNKNYVLAESVTKISFEEELLKRVDNIYSLKHLMKFNAEQKKEEGIVIERRRI
ncbi:MAG: hypothetical protein JW703_00055 [Candidatus Diapherotrites archaeon]|nr:hypothetical protein [Candidatus Diapherotrites archaeon]